MPVIQSPSLLRLELSGNKINRIPAGSVLPRIQWIDLSSNDLTDGGIDPDAFNDITSVRAMILNENSLTKFPVGLPSSIEQLYINDNKIIEFSTLAVQHLSQLQKVEMRNNRVNDQVRMEHSWVIMYRVTLSVSSIVYYQLTTWCQINI